MQNQDRISSVSSFRFQVQDNPVNVNVNEPDPGFVQSPKPKVQGHKTKAFSRPFPAVPPSFPELRRG